MSEIEVFQFPATGADVRTVMIDGEPWFVARDVAAVLGYANGNRDVARHTSERQRREYRIGTPSGTQVAVLLNEPGVYRMVMRSNMPKAIEFQDWLAEEVLPAIRKAGQLEVGKVTPRELALLVIQEADRADRAEQRAAELEPAAHNWEAVQAGDGITLRTFHKKYFSDVRERDFFEHLYRREYLIDQRGKGVWDDERQKHRDGRQHRHPGAKGKPYLYLHTEVDRNDVRRENVRVRPGEAELEFRARLVRDGLPANQTGTDIERRAA